ncbi:putative membrane protein [Ehrlichia cf. muris str. EmCRT]|uniref:Putative membrane protein n=1 Tax=Ehrlichia cf. muris str. EmCRT TaxID=1359167 RepID=A0A0F3NBW1_9RICK|nr:putative membrane protein [Ehrlichia cf. muris str. EmCRT]
MYSYTTLNTCLIFDSIINSSFTITGYCISLNYKKMLD